MQFPKFTKFTLLKFKKIFSPNLLKIENRAMLSIPCSSVLSSLLRCGCALHLFPYRYDPYEKRVHPPSQNSRHVFNFHRFVINGMTLFAMVRFFLASRTTTELPLLLKILNIAWIGVYSLTAIGFYQIANNGEDIGTFVNSLLQYVDEVQAAPKGTYIFYYVT